MRRSSRQVPQKQHNEDRIRRAESWLRRSKATEANHRQAVSDEDVAAIDCEQFIFLWISFNAAYGRELLDDERDDDNPTESQKFNEFLAKILERDSNQAIKTILWETYSDAVRILLKNHYVFSLFWRSVRDSGNGLNWKNSFDKRNKKVFSALAKNNIHAVLREVFDRLYVLRNQLFHGGATFATGWGRSQVRDGSRIMASLVPEILKIMQTDMIKNPDSDTWGVVAFPRVNEGPDQGIR